MHVISARNVHFALPMGVQHLRTRGYTRPSRNGPVLISPEPVSNVYLHPRERIVCWPNRDYNIAFVLYEALWMLAGRNDLAPMAKFVQNFTKYSDNGKTLHGAYGYRWRHALGDVDQLPIIAERLRRDPDDRRCVLQMWEAARDLGKDSKDLPCNIAVTFQRDRNGRLDMVVFNRSNDAFWGTYFANAFHFSILQEFMALWIGCEVGTYTQVSVNFHGYIETLPDMSFFGDMAEDYIGDPIRMEGSAPWNLQLMEDLLEAVDNNFASVRKPLSENLWIETVYGILRTHHVYKTTKSVKEAESVLWQSPGVGTDMKMSMERWLKRRGPVCPVEDLTDHTYVQSLYHPNACSVSGCGKPREDAVHQ